MFGFYYLFSFVCWFVWFWLLGFCCFGVFFLLFVFGKKEYFKALESDQEAVDTVVCQRLSFRTRCVYNLIASLSVYIKDLQYVFSFYRRQNIR